MLIHSFKPPGYRHSRMSPLTSFVDTILIIYIGCPCMLLGAVLSVLVILVYTKNTQIFNSSRVVICMATFFDFGYLLLNLTHWIALYVYDCEIPFFTMTNLMLLKTLLSLRNYFFVVMVLEKFFYYHSPSEFRIFWSLDRAGIVIGTAIALGLMIRIPDVLCLLVTNHSYYGLRNDMEWRTTLLFNDFVSSTCMPLGLVLVLLYASLKTALPTKRPSFLCSQMDICTPSQEQIELMIRNSLMVFVFSTVPQILTSLLQFCIPLHESLQSREILRISNTMQCASDLVSVLCSLSKFFVFVLSNRQLMRSLWKCKSVPISKPE